MSEQDIAGVLLAAMSAEDARRETAGRTPGLGALVSLPDVPYGPSVGKSGLDFPAAGEGYQADAPYAPQSKSYGPDVPVYADALVGGLGYSPGGVQTAIRALGDRVFAAQDRAAAGPGVTVVSPDAAPRPSLWSRLAGKLRRR
jgi:hypothetical protein